MNTKEGEPKVSQVDLNRKYRLLAGVFAFITVVGVCYVFGIFDSLGTKILSSPKDYKSEEIANAEAAKKLKNSDYDKLVDENAEQFVNEVDEDTTSVKEEVPEEEEDVKNEPEPEPEGEAF